MVVENSRRAIIVGGGRVGNRTAVHLTEGGYTVTIIERDEGKTETIPDYPAIQVVVGDGTDIDVMVRPDDGTARRPGPDEAANGEVVHRRYLGPTVLYRVELDGGETIECMHNHSDRIDLDERVGVRVTADHELAWFPADHREEADGAADTAPSSAD